jgi:outer membrane cobalamin receptor
VKNARTNRRAGLRARLAIGACLVTSAVTARPILSEAQQPKVDLSELSLEQLSQATVFTASGHYQDVADAPSSVTIVTAEQIHEYGYRTLADVLRTLRGFVVTNDRNYSSLGVRGFLRPGDFFNTRVLLLVNGHRLSDNVYTAAMIGTEFPVDVDLIRRIEIIRGPGSALYGNNAVFAVINIFTRRGEDVNGVELASSVASLNTDQGRITYGRKVGALDYLLSGAFYTSRGHNSLFYPEFNSPDTNNGIASHVDDDQLGSALASASYRDLNLSAAYGTREKGIPTGSYGTVFSDPGNRTIDAHEYVDLKGEHTYARDWDLSARLFADRYTYHGTYIYPSLLTPTTDPTQNSIQDPSQFTPEVDVADGKLWGLELRGAHAPIHGHLLLAGFEYRDNYRQNQNTYNVNPFQLVFNQPGSSFVAGAYLQDEITLSKTLALNFALRYDDHSRTASDIDPRLALIAHPSPKDSVKLMFGQAFRTPNVFERFYAVPPNVGNPALVPETIRTAELAWFHSITDSLLFSTTVYYSRVDKLISQITTADGSLLYENLPSISSRGTELELTKNFNHGGEWIASYSFQEARDSGTQRLLDDSPRTLGKLNLSQPFARRRLVASLDAQYRSRIITLPGASVSPFTVANFTLLGHALSSRADLSASIYNLLDKHYADPCSGANLQAQIPQDGRGVRFQMTWNLGKR